MSEIIGSISAAITTAKRLNEISKNIRNAEFKNLLADLSMELADTKLRLSKLIEENSELKEELSKLKQSKSGADELIFKDGLYYKNGGDGPFCPGCYDDKRKKIRIHKQFGSFRQFGQYKCPICTKYFN